jgi:hypothetical protein
MKTQFHFFGRIVLAWFIAMIGFRILTNLSGLGDPWLIIDLAFWAALVLLVAAGASHWHRVRVIAGTVDANKLANRHQRQIEIPFEAEVALPLLESSMRELPASEVSRTSPDGTRLRARVAPVDPEQQDISLWKKLYLRLGIAKHNLVLATASQADGSTSVTLLCEPETPAWMDWLFLDEGSNLQNAETVTRAVTRRIGEYRRGERASTHQTRTEKELAVAKLSLLHAQVEPHFLYNTLGSAKHLIATDPVRAEAMLDSLITYLRHSLPRSEDTPSTLGEEVERARSYLDILKIRMGERLQVQIAVPASLSGVPFPAMMLQTLVENAINHGLEPKTGGGTIWISAREIDVGGTNTITVTVADDGNGFAEGTSGTGIGLKNVRERLKLAYAGAASFTIVANYPSGVAASITVPSPAARDAR